MKRTMLWLCGLVWLCAGCATSDDPRKGGLFGYWLHKDDYAQRIEERQQRLAELEAENERQKQESARLEDEQAKIRAELDRQRTLLNEFEYELERLRQSIQQYKAQTQRTQQKKEQITQQIDALNADIAALRANTQLSVQEREANIADLQQYLENLLLLASEL